MKKHVTKKKEAIRKVLNGFLDISFRKAALSFFDILGYRSDRQFELGSNTAEGFVQSFPGDGFNKVTALTDHWESVTLLFQITGEELKLREPGLILDGRKRVDSKAIESYVFMALELAGNDYSRTDLAKITREVNKCFAMPALILFRHGETLTLSIIDRRLNKRDPAKDVLEKVTLIKDIRLNDPHRAHIEILYDLSLNNLYKHPGFSNFVSFHDAWRKTLDTNELNKRFYKEVADWYFWAVDTVSFPEGSGENEKVRNATGVIRLITRLFFIWFLKEKNLVPPDLFRPSVVRDILKGMEPAQSSYYLAVLQNLFFATLNQEMNTPSKPNHRRFRGKNPKGLDSHYMVHNVYRHHGMLQKPNTLLALFENIPFLNGGLFECLDRKEKKGTLEIRVDGFSDVAMNQPKVPNFLFFSESREVDLNDAYGTKSKKYKVRGLIDIFESYKFTINENTPIEEEVALDPELLGKVFENLLAAYNPETDKTARKETGSFYTPREIVNYMVDEVLREYLLKRLLSSKGDEDTKKQTRCRLTRLLAYNREGHDFSESETARLIEAIDHFKILDPACGSGAFPMGILHKMVFLLSKLDPENKQWEQRQIDKAFEIPDSDIQEKVILDIKQAFRLNKHDYGRKLYLIENCIFGVDIQPIAVQIAKLRFFISLIVDQKTDNSLENRGIRPLPNLETRFVAADALVPVKRDKQIKLFRDTEIDRKEEKLKKVRHEYFTARTLEKKLKCQEADKRLRNDIGGLLRKEHPDLKEVTSERLAAWNPYDQNTSADFFDPYWMFALKDGFDAVIGNPPYVRIQHIDKDRAAYYKREYESAKGNYDLYVVFVERGLNLLYDEGLFAYIVPHKFFNAKYGEGLRGLISKGKFLSKIVHFGHHQMFSSATNYTCLLFMDKAGISDFPFLNIEDVRAWINEGRSIEEKVNISEGGDEWNFVIGKGKSIFNTITDVSSKLKETSHMFVGLQTDGDDVFILEKVGESRNHFICSSRSTGKEHRFEKLLLKPLLKGSLSIGRYQIKNVKYLIFPYKNDVVRKRSGLIEIEFLKKTYPLTWEYLEINYKRLAKRRRGTLGNSWYGYVYKKNHTRFEVPKIIVPSLAPEGCFSFDEKGSYYFVGSGGGGGGGYGIVLKESIKFDYLYLLGLLNSKLISYHLKNFSTSFQGGYLALNKQYIENLPIYFINLRNATENMKHNLIVLVVKYINYLKNGSGNTHPINTQISRYFEQIVDGMVYELYFAEELFKAGYKIFEPLFEEKLPTLNRNEGNPLETLRPLYERLYQKDHPLQRNLTAIQSMETIRIIEGKD